MILLTIFVFLLSLFYGCSYTAWAAHGKAHGGDIGMDSSTPPYYHDVGGTIATRAAMAAPDTNAVPPTEDDDEEEEEQEAETQTQKETSSPSKAEGPLPVADVKTPSTAAGCDDREDAELEETSAGGDVTPKTPDTVPASPQSEASSCPGTPTSKKPGIDAPSSPLVLYSDNDTFVHPLPKLAEVDEFTKVINKAMSGDTKTGMDTGVVGPALLFTATYSNPVDILHAHLKATAGNANPTAAA